VTDDPLLDLFALDLPSPLDCAPDLSLTLPLHLPPIAGGAPDYPWDWMWDRIQDLWGLGGDLAEAIAKAFATLFSNIWAWVGGTVRWLYNELSRALNWLKARLDTVWDRVTGWIPRMIDWVWTKLVDTWNWVTKKIPQAIGWLWDKLVDTWDWVTKKIPQAIGWLWDKLVDTWDNLRRLSTWVTTWLWPKLTDIWDMATRRIPQAIGWIWDKLVDIWDMATRGIPQAISWMWDRLTAIWDFVRINLWRHISGAAEGIGSAIGDAFGKVGDALGDALGKLGDTLADAIRWPWEHIFEPFTDVVNRKLAIPGKLIRGQYTSLLDLVDDVVDPAPIIIAGIAGAIILSLVISMITAGIMQILVTPLCEPHVQASRARVGVELLTIGVVQDALNRGFIDEPTATDHLSRMGYDGTSRKALLALRHYIPPPTDLIRMSVREVFDPEARSRLTLDADFPAAFEQYARLLGIQPEWARNYWAMHWDLPSPSQGYEMLHRGLITDADLAGLLKALDYAPVWRDKLQAISYSPITRVDLRRLYKGGVISQDDVFRGYKALGYDEQRARWLTDWTTKYYSPEDESQLDKYTEATASQIRLAYRRHIISRPEAEDQLIDIGYTEDLADFLLSIDDAQLALNPVTDAGIPVRDLTVSIIRSAYAERLWDRARAQAELEVLGYLPWEADLLLQLEDLAQERELAALAETVVKELYLANAIDKAQAGAQLDAIDVLPERRDLLLTRWELQRAQKPRRLTLAQVQRAYRKGIFSEADFLAELDVMGYNDRDAGIILAIT